MKLFEEKVRIYDGVIDPFESIYQYYDRSARPEMAIVRKTLEAWFSNFPEDERLELKTRMQKSFLDPFYELFIHELFLRQGFQLEVHPHLLNTSKRPDFLAKGKGLEFYIEAKNAGHLSKEEQARENLLKSLYSRLDKAKIKDFSFWVKRVEIKSKGQPSWKKMIQFIEQEVQKLDPDEIIKRSNKISLEDLHSIKYEESGIVSIEVALIANHEDYREFNSETITIFPIDTEWINDKHIRDSFRKKAMRYGELDKPLLLCLNDCTKWSVHEDSILDTFFGQRNLIIPEGKDGKPDIKNSSYSRKQNGLFNNSLNQYRTVSGVLINDVNESSFLFRNHWLIENPHSQLPLDFNNIQLSKIIRKDFEMVKVKGFTIGEILKFTGNIPYYEHQY